MIGIDPTSGAVSAGDYVFRPGQTKADLLAERARHGLVLDSDAGARATLPYPVLGEDGGTLIPRAMLRDGALSGVRLSVGMVGGQPRDAVDSARQLAYLNGCVDPAFRRAAAAAPGGFAWGEVFVGYDERAGMATLEIAYRQVRP